MKLVHKLNGVNCIRDAKLDSDGNFIVVLEDLTERPASSEEIAYVNKETWKHEVYAIAKELLDSVSSSYPISEIATWPTLSEEIIQYNSSGIIGHTMTNIIARGWHDANSLSVLLTPKIIYQNAVLQARDTHIENISNIPDTTHNYDTALGWPS